MDESDSKRKKKLVQTKRPRKEDLRNEIAFMSLNNAFFPRKRKDLVHWYDCRSCPVFRIRIHIFFSRFHWRFLLEKS